MNPSLHWLTAPSTALNAWNTNVGYVNVDLRSTHCTLKKEEKIQWKKEDKKIKEKRQKEKKIKKKRETKRSRTSSPSIDFTSKIKMTHRNHSEVGLIYIKNYLA